MRVNIIIQLDGENKEFEDGGFLKKQIGDILAWLASRKGEDFNPHSFPYFPREWTTSAFSSEKDGNKTYTIAYGGNYRTPESISSLFDKIESP